MLRSSVAQAGRRIASFSGRSAMRRSLSVLSRSVTAAPVAASPLPTIAFQPLNKNMLAALNSSRSFHVSAVARETITIQLPRPSESINEGSIGSLEKGEGDYVEEDETVIIVETDKTSLNINAPSAGTISKIFVEEGETVEVGADLFNLDVGVGAPPEKPAEATKSESSSSSAPPATAATPSPAAPPASSPKKAEKKPEPKKAMPTVQGGNREETRVKMTRIRLKTAERLKESQNVAAMLTTFNEIDMSNLMEFRNQYKDEMLKKYGVKLGFMSAFCKAAAYALKDQPAVNAYIEGNEIVYHNYADISVAVASPKGLVVPVIRNVEKMSFMEIEQAIGDMGQKARDGSLAIEDMDGGTFTISNGGVFGSLMGTPIINPPQSAILGMHGVFDRPVAIKGQVEIRPMMYVALTYDHRLIDGREAVTFLRKIKAAVEDPRVMLLEP